jgi:3-oxoacyl-[acyl-carrier-protein] synthase-3
MGRNRVNEAIVAALGRIFRLKYRLFMSKAVILGTGSCLPKRIVTNAELEQMVETSDEWITSRTGIRSRHIAGRGEQNYQLAAKAGRRALAVTGIDPQELDLIIVATISPT